MTPRSFPATPSSPASPPRVAPAESLEPFTLGALTVHPDRSCWPDASQPFVVVEALGMDETARLLVHGAADPRAVHDLILSGLRLVAASVAAHCRNLDEIRAACDAVSEELFSDPLLDPTETPRPTDGLAVLRDENYAATMPGKPAVGRAIHSVPR